MTLTLCIWGQKLCCKSTAFCFICLAMENLPLLTAVINLKKTHSHFSVSCRKARCRPVSWGGEELWIDTFLENQTCEAPRHGAGAIGWSQWHHLSHCRILLWYQLQGLMSVLDLLFTWDMVCHVSICRKDLDENLGCSLGYTLAEVNFESWLPVLTRKSTWKCEQSIFSGWGVSVKIYEPL